MQPERTPIQITPGTTIGDLLAAVPDLESVLARRSPSYGLLQGPALRRAVAAHTTIAQLAVADGLSIGELVAELRTAAGSDAAAADAAGPGRPAWADPGHADRSFDARPTIDRGGHPLDRVLHDVGELAPGEVLELITPFVPAPLIEIVRARGFEAHTSVETPGECCTYFRARAHGPEGT